MRDDEFTCSVCNRVVDKRYDNAVLRSQLVAADHDVMPGDNGFNPKKRKHCAGSGMPSLVSPSLRLPRVAVMPD